MYEKLLAWEKLLAELEKGRQFGEKEGYLMAEDVFSPEEKRDLIQIGDCIALYDFSTTF